MDVIRLRHSEKKLATRVFARSFFDYPLMVIFTPIENVGLDIWGGIWAV